MLLGVTLFPDVLKKAQEELGRVLGNTEDQVLRLPSFDDRASLPYAEAIFKEAVQWHVESFIWPNIWAMSRDPNDYPNPDEFEPERFLGTSPALNPFKFIFGFGRRVCVGQHYADAGVWMMIVSLLAAFNVTYPVGPDGKEERFTMQEGHAQVSPTVNLRIEPRSNTFATVVRAAGAEASAN